MFNFLIAEADQNQVNMLVNFAIFPVLIAAFYFFLIRPQNKKKKAEDEMRKTLTIGDEITTIGGISGRVVNIKEDLDSIIIETSIDRTKIMLKRWAIASVDTIKDTVVK